MSNEIQIFTSKDFGEIRIINEDGRAMFAASDVAKRLGYSNTRDAISRHCKGVVKRDIPTKGGIQAINFIPEGDVYRLTAHSKLKTAEKFEGWVFDEVLPTIRRTGSYSMIPKDYPSALRALADEYEKKQMLLAENESMKPKADFYDTVANSDKLLPMDKVAKILDMGIGRNSIFKILREHKWLMDNNAPYQKYVQYGYFKLVERTTKDASNNDHIYTVTLVKQKGLDKIRKLLEENGYRSKNSMIGA